MEEVLVGHLVVVVDISDLTEKEDIRLMEKSHNITTQILKVKISHFSWQNITTCN